MKRSLLLFLIATASCQSFSKSDKPDDFYGDDKMAQIMSDIYLYDGITNSDRASLRKNGVLATDLIYTKYNTDSITYKKNFHYYADREEEYLQLMDRVQEILEQEKDSAIKRQDQVKAEQEKFKSLTNKDSLKLKNKEIRQDLL